MQRRKVVPALGLISILLIGVGILVWLTLVAQTPLPPLSDPKNVKTTVWGFLYDSAIPPGQVIFAAILIALMAAGFIALIELRSSDRARRSLQPSTYPLSPRLLSANTRGHFSGEIAITVLVPAHNEHQILTHCLDELKKQLRPIDRIIVVSDNSNDGTTYLARIAGVEIYETVDNTQKKAGALNQVLRTLLPGLHHNDIVMVMDADTVLDPGFIAAAVRRFENDRGLAAVGGIFYGEPGVGLIGQLQRNEYVRYARQLARRRGQVFVLTGTSTMFRSIALRTVAESRGTMLPGIKGDVYDTSALTEDNELTLAMKTLGALIESPAQCSVVTELMPNLNQLWKQRMRWQRGALENIGAYGVTRPTLRYWGQQLGLGYSVLSLTSFLGLTVLTFLSVDSWVWFPFWLGLGGIFILERLVTVWKGGIRARLLSVLLIPELVYDMFLNLVFIKSVLDISFNREATWGAIDRHHTPFDLKGAAK